VLEYRQKKGRAAPAAGMRKAGRAREPGGAPLLGDAAEPAQPAWSGRLLRRWTDRGASASTIPLPDLPAEGSPGGVRRPRRRTLLAAHVSTSETRKAPTTVGATTPLRLWGASDRGDRLTPPSPVYVFPAASLRAAVSPDNRYPGDAHDDGTIQLWPGHGPKETAAPGGRPDAQVRLPGLRSLTAMVPRSGHARLATVLVLETPAFSQGSVSLRPRKPERRAMGSLVGRPGAGADARQCPLGQPRTPRRRPDLALRLCRDGLPAGAKRRPQGSASLIAYWTATSFARRECGGEGPGPVWAEGFIRSCGAGPFKGGPVGPSQPPGRRRDPDHPLTTAWLRLLPSLPGRVGGAEPDRHTKPAVPSDHWPKACPEARLTQESQARFGRLDARGGVAPL